MIFESRLPLAKFQSEAVFSIAIFIRIFNHGCEGWGAFAGIGMVLNGQKATPQHFEAQSLDPVSHAIFLLWDFRVRFSRSFPQWAGLALTY